MILDVFLFRDGCTVGAWDHFTCLIFFFLATASRRMSGGAILASLYKAGRGVAFSVPVIIRHALLSSGSTFFAWHDLSNIGEQYSAVE